MHGFIHFNELEQKLIDTQAFQRLHDIHQLGMAYYVYPGATHSRFEHSLGTMELATRIFERILDKKYSCPKEPLEQDYWKQIIRLAALCHDLGHLPFSHVAEKELLGEGGHENWTLKIIQSEHLKPVWQEVKKLYPKKNVEQDILKISVGEEKFKSLSSKRSNFSAWEKIFAQVISGDFFGADRIDYLLRDAKCTGVAYGLFDYHQLIEMLCALPSLNSQNKTWELGIEEDGVASCEALLLARHFMHQRVYQYSSVKAYSFHLARFMKELYGQSSDLKNLSTYLMLTDHEVLSSLRKAVLDKSFKGHKEALCLTDRSLRFKAIPLAISLNEKKWNQLKKELKIPEDSILWRPSKSSSGAARLNFLVLQRRGTVVPASTCSNISIPSDSKSWIYVAPRYEKKLLEYLEKSYENVMIPSHD